MYIPTQHEVFVELSKLLPQVIPEICGIEVRQEFDEPMEDYVKYSIRISKDNYLIHMMTHSFYIKGFDHVRCEDICNSIIKQVTI